MKVYVIRCWDYISVDEYGEIEEVYDPEKEEEPALFRTKEAAKRMEMLLCDDYRNMGILFDSIEKEISIAPYRFVEDVLGETPTVEQFGCYIMNINNL